MIHSNTWNPLTVCKWINNIELLNDFSFSCLTGETIAIQEGERISSNCFTNEIIYKLFTYKSYLNVQKKMINSKYSYLC